MSLHNVSPGDKAPEEFNVIIEIPMNADPIKYEVRRPLHGHVDALPVQLRLHPADAGR
jgi:inorganic pyrophosphatase